MCSGVTGFSFQLQRDCAKACPFEHCQQVLDREELAILGQVKQDLKFDVELKMMQHRIKFHRVEQEAQSVLEDCVNKYGVARAWVVKAKITQHLDRRRPPGLSCIFETSRDLKKTR